MGVSGTRALIQNQIHAHTSKRRIRDPECNLVVDGLSYANQLYHSLIPSGFDYSHNPTYLYQKTIEFIELLKQLKLKVIKVFIDAINNPSKADTYVSRRASLQKRIIKFWESGLKKKEHLGIPNCCIDAVMAAFTDTYGMSVVGLSGIDGDRDIARYSYLNNALVLTTDSDFIFYNLPGVIFINGYKGGPLYITRRHLLMKHLNIQEFQLYYFVVLNGNDFLKRQAINTESGKKFLPPPQLLEEIKTHCATKQDCEKHFKEHTNQELREIYEKVASLYASNQVDLPWSALTNDVAEVEAVKSKIPKDALLEISNEFSRSYNTTGFNMIFTSFIGVPLLQTPEFNESSEIIAKIVKRTYKLLGKHPFYYFQDCEVSFYKSEESVKARIENNIDVIKERISNYRAIKQEPYEERVEKLKRVFREMVAEEEECRIDPRSFVILVTKYVMNRCFPSKTELISNVIEELLEHHREYHEMKFQKDTSVENRKLAFTLFTYLSVFYHSVLAVFSLLSLIDEKGKQAAFRDFFCYCYPCILKIVVEFEEGF